MNKYSTSGSDIEVGMGVVLVMVMVQVMEVVVLFMVVVLVLGEVMVVAMVVPVIIFSVRLHLCARHRRRNFPYLIFTSSTALKDGHYFPYFIDVGTQLVRSHKASS